MPGLILCGVDGSETSAKAVRVATALGDALGARVVLLYVAEVKVPPPGSAFAYDKLEEAAVAEGRRVLEELRTLGVGESAEERVEPGSPALKLKKIAEAEGADMIVVGSRGHGTLKSALLGSVSKELAAYAPCPVVVVPRDARVAA